MNTEREMSLQEWVDTLPSTHRARTEYNKLLQDSAELDALYMGGVDNWEWYNESLRDAGLLDD